MLIDACDESQGSPKNLAVEAEFAAVLDAGETHGSAAMVEAAKFGEDGTSDGAVVPLTATDSTDLAFFRRE